MTSCSNLELTPSLYSRNRNWSVKVFDRPVNSPQEPGESWVPCDEPGLTIWKLLDWKKRTWMDLVHVLERIWVRMEMEEVK